MEVLLINPPSDYLEDQAALPPLGLLYLGAALESAGHDPKVIDLNLKSTTIEGHNPGWIGLTCVTASYVIVKNLITELRTLYPGVPIVVGGPHISSIYTDVPRLGADFGCIGDGESYVLDVFCRASYACRVTIGHTDINSFPIPARHLVPIHSYTRTLNNLKMTSLISQRGCPYPCTFCCHYDGYSTVRMRAIGNVIEEVHKIKDMGFGAISFHDDELNLSSGRLFRLCTDLESTGMAFKANVRADLLTMSQAEAMSRANFKLLCVGVESGSEQILRATRKGTTPEINSRARKLCKEVGIKFKAFVMVGLPGESRSTIEETKRWLIDNEVDDLTATLFIPFPGTPVFNHPDRYDIGFKLNYESHPMPFRGGNNLQLPHVTWTSHLTSEELAEAPVKLETEVRQALGI